MEKAMDLRLFVENQHDKTRRVTASSKLGLYNARARTPVEVGAWMPWDHLSKQQKAVWAEKGLGKTEWERGV